MITSGFRVVQRTSCLRGVSALASCTPPVVTPPPSIVNRGAGSARLCTSQMHRSHLQNLLSRGAYEEVCFKHVKGSDVKNVAVVSNGKHVEITWSDGSVSKFHSLWLRYSCFCSQCRTDNRGQPMMQYEDIPDDQRIQTAVDDGEGCLVVRWKGDDADHTGLFPLRFLKYNCYSKDTLNKKRENRRITFSKDYVIPRISYDEVASGQSGVYKLVKKLNETGITLVEGAPCEDGMSKKICQKISPLMQNTVYGEVWEVKVENKPIDASYTGAELKLHMDQLHYEAPPGIQVLHCLEFDDSMEGGENQFVDLFHVAETYRATYPEYFDFLCKVPSTYETQYYKRFWPLQMRYKRPIFSCNDYGDLVGVVWHPHMMGPLEIQEEYLDDFFKAFKKMADLVNNFPQMYRHRLRAGDMMMFNNRRVIHGRAGFDSVGGQRTLQGCYVEVSEFKSQVQVLANLVGEGEPVKRVGNNDWY